MKKGIKDIIKKVIILISIILVIALIFTFASDRPTFADSGFSTSHSSGGSSHSSSHSSYSSGSGGDMDFAVSIVTFIIIMIIFLIKSAYDKKNGIAPVHNPPFIPEQTNIENYIKKYLPDFNTAQFLNEGYKIYYDVQKAWMNFKLEDVKDVLTDELYNMYESQLATLEVKGEQNIMKDFVLNRSYLRAAKNQNNTLTITAGYIIEFYDYIADRNTGKTIRGESNRKMRVVYEMKFRQSLDQTKKIDKCPNCGAPLKINSFGTCEYCRSKIVTENTKWVLTEKKAIDQYYI